MRLFHPVTPTRLSSVQLPTRDSPFDLSRALGNLRVRATMASPAAAFAAAAPAQAAAAAAAAPRLVLAGIRISQLTLDIGISLGFGSIINGKNSTALDFYLVEFIATSDQITIPGQPGMTAIPGVGFRMGLTTTRVNGQVAGNLATIAASATYSGASNYFKWNVYGCPSALVTQFNNTFTPSLFDVNAMKSLGTALGDLSVGMVNQAKSDATKFDPQVLYVVEDVSPTPSTLLACASNGYGIHRITSGDTYEAAMDHLRQNAGNTSQNPYDQVDPLSVLVVYANIVGGAGRTPTSAQQNVAEAIQRLGQ